MGFAWCSAWIDILAQALVSMPELTTECVSDPLRTFCVQEILHNGEIVATECVSQPLDAFYGHTATTSTYRPFFQSGSSFVNT